MANIHKKTEYLGFQFLKISFSVLPRSICLSIGGALGSIIYSIDRKHRQIALSNLNTAFSSQFSIAKQKKLARASFKHFGRVFAEIIKTRSMKKEKIRSFISVEGIEHLENALQKGKGALIFSAHLGNWEMATALVSQIGKVNVIARPLDNKQLEDELLQIRKKFGANVIYKQQAARPILRVLKDNEMVAILIDQNTVRNQGVFVDFFGKSASTTPSLAAFFLKTGAPLIPVFCYPIQSGKYQLKILPPLKTIVTGDEEQDVLKITQLCTKIIQNQIQENPKVWLWFHDRWKTRPEEEERSGKIEHER
jgi:KDO2-lipid IV(A) lauroyltransferase